MSQPWSLSAIRELHDRALVVGFNFLDTIAWDVVYSSQVNVDKPWRFAARHADVLLYNSEFSRRRFDFRFPVGRAIQAVTHHSLNADEYVRGPVADSGEILVMGNEYDHKDVAAAAELVGDGFPFERIVAVGIERAPRPNVRTLSSGRIPESEFENRIASAKVMVFPSYYEGFGLPVVRALAHGRAVVVRESALWHEIAGSTKLPGRLLSFESPHELVEAVGSALHGDGQARTIPQGGLLAGAEPIRWRGCAARMLSALERALDDADGERWAARDDALSLLNR